MSTGLAPPPEASSAAAPSLNGDGKAHRDRLEFLEEYVFVCPDGETAGVVAKLTDRGLDTAVLPAKPPRGFRQPDLSGRKVIVVSRSDKQGRREAGARARQCRKAGAGAVLEWVLYGLGDVYPTLAEYLEQYNLGAVLLIDQPWRRPAPADPEPDDQGGANEARVEPSANGSHQAPRLVNEAPDDPYRLARLLVMEHQHPDGRAMRFYRGAMYRHVRGAYRELPSSEVSSALATTIKAEFDRLNLEEQQEWEAGGKVDGRGRAVGAPEARKVSTILVANARLAMQSMTLLDGDIEAPAWIDGPGPFNASEVVPTRNTLVYLPEAVKLHPLHYNGPRPPDTSRALAAPTPRFFCTYALDFDFDLEAPPPDEWLRFLDSLWPSDPESINTLQEWFGYCLTSDTRQQKILFLVGPKRGGKDTIARILTALVGHNNVGDPTLAGLASPFGMAPLIGKPLAIVSDARLSGRIDTSVIVERLLTISGEGRLTIDRKYQEAWTGKLPTRFVLISNELPKLNDASGALASRLILLRLTESFLGREDKGLFDRLALELPGILLWAIEGWRRLRERGRFVQPKSGEDLIESMEELTSPILAFVRERCDQGAGKEVETKIMFDAWRDWCSGVGRKETGTAQSFARDLRAACSGISSYLTKRAGIPVRLYQGIDLK